MHARDGRSEVKRKKQDGGREGGEEGVYILKGQGSGRVSARRKEGCCEVRRECKREGIREKQSRGGGGRRIEK